MQQPSESALTSVHKTSIFYVLVLCSTNCPTLSENIISNKPMLIIFCNNSGSDFHHLLIKPHHIDIGVGHVI